MFRALYENFQNEAINELNQNIVRYQSVEPNLTVVNTQNNYPFPNSGNTTQSQQAQNTGLQQSLNNLGTVVNPTYGITTTNQANLGAVFTGIPDSLGNQLKDCRTYTGLAGLSNLIGRADIANEQRCGWRYKPGQGLIAEVAQGAFGKKSGPLDPARPPVDSVGNGTQYFWNLQDAEKQMVTDICKAAVSCQDMGAIPGSAMGDFSNVCGYCKTSKKVIPIRRQGNQVLPRYNTPDNQCAPSEIVTVSDAATKCPPPNPEQQQAVYSKCIKDGNLERDCVTLSALYAGCNPNGTLISALNMGNNNQDYADKLRLKKSFQVYQSLANPVLSEDVIKNGNATMYASFMNIYNLNQNQNKTDPNKTSEQNRKIQIAAQDLCRQSGLFETFNFCSDLTDQTRDYEVICMQQEFLRQGGTLEGKAYPKTKDPSVMWGDYKRSVTDLVKLSNSTNANEQRTGLNSLKGLGLQVIPTTLPRGEQSQGVEIFWFRRNGIFLGRRPVLSATGSNLPNFNVGGGIVEDTGFADNVEMISLFDLRPATAMKMKFGAVTDDGFTLALNQDPFAPTDSTRVFSKLYDQGPTWHASQCFDIQAENTNVPNIITWYWYENGGGAVFHPFFGDCTKNTWIEIAAKGRPLDSTWRDICYFTQEIDAPMLTFGSFQRGGKLLCQERRMASRFPVSNVSGSTFLKVNNRFMPSNFTVMKLPAKAWTMTKPLAYSAVRTIVICFSLESTDKERLLFGWGQKIQVWASKQSDNTFAVRLQASPFTSNVVYNTTPFIIQKNAWNLAVITLTTASQFTKKISGVKFFVQEMGAVKNGNVLAGITEQSIQPNLVLFDEVKVNSSVAGSLQVGDSGLTMQLGWIDFFDKLIPTTDVPLWKKVVNREWLGRWYE